VDVDQDDVGKRLDGAAQFRDHVLGAPFADAFGPVELGKKGVAAVGAREGATPR